MLRRTWLLNQNEFDTPLSLASYIACAVVCQLQDSCLYSSADKSPVWFCHIPYLVVGFPGSIHCHLLFFFFFFLIAPLLLIVRMHACIWLKSRSDLMNRLQTNLHVASGARLAYFSPSLCSRKIDVFAFARAHVQPRKADAEVTWPAGGPVHWRKQKNLSLSLNPPRFFSVDYLGSLVATAINHVMTVCNSSYTFLITVPCLSCCHCRTLKCNVSLPSSGQIMYWLNHGCNKFNFFFFYVDNCIASKFCLATYKLKMK